MSTVLPPREIFETVIEPDVSGEKISDYIGGYGEDNYIKTVCPPQGGMYMYTADEAYPFPTHPYPNAARVNAIVKKHTLLLFQPFTKILSPLKFLENYLTLYNRMAADIYESIPADGDGRIRIPYLKEQYYDPLCKELWKFLYHFLMGIGISEETAWFFGKNIATVLQYDNAYREPLKDIFSETSKEKLDRKELKRLMDLFQQRAIGLDADKFISLGKILTWMLWIPKVKKAFKQALSQVEFKNFQFNKSSQYHSLKRTDYNYGGFGSDIRLAVYYKIRSEHLSLKN